MYSVSGVVKDEKGVGIARAVVSNGKKGIFTDKDGNYQIESDIYNNNASCSFSVQVSDQDAPTITCPVDMTVSNDAGVCGQAHTTTD